MRQDIQTVEDIHAYRKTIVVEGASDRKKVQEIVNEPVDIICTNGTIGLSRLDELIESLERTRCIYPC